MSNALTDLQLEQLQAAVNAALDERDAFPGRTHSDHHRFVEELIDRERRREERREKLRQQVIGWGAIAFLTALGTGAYNLCILLLEVAKKGGH